MPLRYLFEPWKAPKAVQEKAKCIIGEDYPLPMVNHKEASNECAKMMNNVIDKFKGKGLCSIIFITAHTMIRVSGKDFCR